MVNSFASLKMNDLHKLKGNLNVFTYTSCMNFLPEIGIVVYIGYITIKMLGSKAHTEIGNIPESTTCIKFVLYK